MKRILLALGCCLALTACGQRATQPNPGTNHQPGPQLDAALNKQLPAVPGLDALRSASSVSFSGLTMVANSHATINGGGELVLDGSAGNFAWAIFDLGVQPADFAIGSVNFPNAPDWSTILPLPQVFVGVSIYSSNHWEFAQRKDDGTPASFAGLPPGATFLSATNHSYLAILGDSVTLDFGDKLDILGTAGPGGELPAVYKVDFTGLPAKAGLQNQIIVKGDSTGGDLVTFCPDPADNGGALVRFTYDPATDTYADTVTTLLGAGQMLQGCYRYRLDYYADGRLAIGAAKSGPNTIRAIKEDTPGAGTFGLDSASPAVDNTILPTDFSNPQYDYKVNAAGNYQCLFLANNGKLGVSYEIAGSNGVDFGGPDILGDISMKLIGNTDIVCSYRKLSGIEDTLQVLKMQQRPAGADFGTSHEVFADPVFQGAHGTSLVLGLGGSIHVAHGTHDTVADRFNLGFGYSADGTIGGTWTATTADNGGVGTNSVGITPSVGVLGDGTPVIAYYDETNLSLRFAISTVPDVNNVTGGTWTTYRIDTSRFGSQVGQDPALGVLKRSGHPDKVIVAYGVNDGTNQVLRLIRFDAPAH